ncbi:unnamed protein product [Ceutorhynchus assimilis]|uniref:C2H2-type domain-containing protein n=1 Tax=Ceutorhynchus assimilis TaxID=467358 RepID=A0A9N9MXI7_9CUCU|nr:unnamed protein product [Ceutorhynchus assimilis]
MPVSCLICFKVFSTQSSVNRHLKNVHKQEKNNIISYPYDHFNSKCLEENCGTSFRFISELRCHLETVHNKTMNKENIFFASEEEFNPWFHQICDNNNLEYVRHKQKDQPITYFNCNRSGTYKSNIEIRKRAIKSQGSCKIGHKCTSQNILNQNSTGQYCAQYYKTHYGHTIEVQHIHLSKETRINIATKLASGVSVSR